MNNSNKNQDISILMSEDLESPEGYKKYEINDLENIKEESCDNIYIGDLFDYFEIRALPELIDTIISKIKQNGRLLIKAPDILQLSWYTCRLNLELSKLRYILYDTNRKACYSLDEILNVFSSINAIDIETAYIINGYEYSILVSKK